MRCTARRLAAILTLTLAACARPERMAPVSGSDPLLDAETPSAFSVYDLPSTWRDQRGTARTLASLGGRPQVVAMIYTHCSTTCPLVFGQLERIAAETDAGIVLVSLDPARDTPGRLAAYATEHGLDATRWTLLGGTDDNVRELAATLGIRYQRVSPTELAHSNAITLLDAAGAVRHTQPTLAGTDETIRIARALPAARGARPTPTR